MADADELLEMDRADLTLLASDTADRAGAGQRAVELAKATLDLLDADADPVRAGLVHSRLAYYLWVRGDSQAAIAEHRAAVAMVPADPPSVIRSRVVGGLAGILMPTGHYRESKELAEEALATLRATGSTEGEARLLNVVGVDLVGLGDVDTGLEHLREAVRTAREPGQLDSLMGAIHNLGFFLAQTDRLEEAFAVTTDGLETARRVGLQRRFGGGLRATMGDILNRSGRWEEVEQVTREGLEDEVDSSGSIYLRATRAMVFAARGDLAAADEDLRAAALGAADVDPDVQAYVLQAQAERALIDGRPADALRFVEEGLAQYAGSDEYLLVVPLLGDGVAAAAELTEHGRAFRQPEEVEAASATAETPREPATSISERTAGTSAATPSLKATLATIAAEWTRIDGTSDPDAWLAAAEASESIPMRTRQRGPAHAPVRRSSWREAHAIGRPTSSGLPTWPPPSWARARSRTWSRRSPSEPGSTSPPGKQSLTPTPAMARGRSGGRAHAGRDPRAYRPASGRSSSWLPPGDQMPRSPKCCSSARRPRASTSPTSSTSSVSTTESRRRRSPCGSAPGNLARAPDPRASERQSSTSGRRRRRRPSRPCL